MQPINRLIPLLPLVALTLSPLSSQADGSLNTRHEQQTTATVAPPAYQYHPLPRNGYHYPKRGNDIIIIPRNPGPSGYDIYQRNLRRHRQANTEQATVDNRPRQCLGNHCGNEGAEAGR